MKRYRSGDLTAWLERKDRKPLVLRGARQTGKTWLVRAWVPQQALSLVELNFERDPAAASCFADNDPAATLRRIEALAGKRLPANGTTLLFLDEIQAAPEVLPKLRWLAEERSALPVIAAGSLLDFALEAPRHGVPVGRIGYLHLEPFGFQEFLEALGEDILMEHLAGDVTASS